jgi:DNA repair exonuclease SbcCD ATPase subunit
LIRFTFLSIKNFLSYGAEPTIIALDRPGTTLILGEDLDNTSQGTGGNGVGKTVIINALTYGVYDKPVSNISKDNLVNNINKKHMEVIVEFEKGGNKYRIRRVRKEKAYAAGNYVELFENDVDITPDSVANTNKLIEKIIGLPYELFVRIVVFSATNVPFLDLPVRHPTSPNQTDIIEELFDLKTLSEKSSILNEQRKEIDTNLERQKDKVKLLEQEHERHKKQLQSAKQRVVNWDEENEQEIERLKKKLERVKAINVSEQKDLLEELIELMLNLSEAESRLKELNKEYTSTETELEQSKKELIHLENEKCPYCLQQYENAKIKIEDTKKAIERTSDELNQLLEQLESSAALVEETKEEQDHIESKITISKEELDQLHGKSSEYERRITELENTTNPYLEPLQELEEIELDSINYDEINKLTERVEHMKFLYKILTKKDSFVRKVLLNKNLPFLNQRLQEYLTMLGLSHQVEFTHEMTASITQFGRAMDFGNLSNGQRARVNIALSFAFRDVLQQLHERINVCMLDEVLDVGLDGPGVTAAARMLKRKARDENLSLYIISHRDEIDSAFDNTMLVQLSEGFSTIMEEK